MSTTKTATVYAVLKADRSYGIRDPETGLRPVQEVKVDRTRQEYPSQLRPGEIVVRLAITVPNAAFDPLMPRAEIVVPESMIDQAPIVVEALDTEATS